MPTHHPISTWWGPAWPRALDEVLRGELGFDHEGRQWFYEELAVTVERPASSLEPPGAEAVTLEIPGIGDLLVISIEDLTCDRPGSWAATGHYGSWAQAVRLAQNETPDQERLARRAGELRLDQHLVSPCGCKRREQQGASNEATLPGTSMSSTRSLRAR